jgi:hypothetical protein
MTQVAVWSQINKKTHKYRVAECKILECWTCWCITWPVGFTRLKKENTRSEDFSFVLVDSRLNPEISLVSISVCLCVLSSKSFVPFIRILLCFHNYSLSWNQIFHHFSITIHHSKIKFALSVLFLPVYYIQYSVLHNLTARSFLEDCFRLDARYHQAIFLKPSVDN